MIVEIIKIVSRLTVMVKNNGLKGLSEKSLSKIILKKKVVIAGA